MVFKKILAVAALILAALLTLALVGQLGTVFQLFANVIRMLSGKLDAYKAGNVFGRLLYWVFHIAATVVLWQMLSVIFPVRARDNTIPAVSALS